MLENGTVYEEIQLYLYFLPGRYRDFRSDLRLNRLSMLQKLPIMYIIALAVHELEELKFPGGFVEQVAGMTGMQGQNKEE